MGQGSMNVREGISGDERKKKVERLWVGGWRLCLCIERVHGRMGLMHGTCGHGNRGIGQRVRRKGIEGAEDRMGRAG